MANIEKIAKIECSIFYNLYYFQSALFPALSKMSTPCLCNVTNKRTDTYASNPKRSALGTGLMNAAVTAFTDIIDVWYVDALRKDGFHDAADALASFNMPQKRLVHFLFRNNPGRGAEALAKHVRNMAVHSTAEGAHAALAASYCVPRASDLTLPLWYEMVPSTHVCS